MHFRMDKKKLARITQDMSLRSFAHKIADANMKMEVVGDRLTIIVLGDGLDFLSVNVDVEGIEDGVVALNTESFMRVFSLCFGGADDIEIRKNNGNLELFYKAKTLSVKCFSENKFVSFSDKHMVFESTILCGDLLGALKSVTPCMQVAGQREYLSGVLLDSSDENDVCFVASNGHMLAKKNTRFQTLDNSKIKRITIPARSAKFMQRFLARRRNKPELVVSIHAGFWLGTPDKPCAKFVADGFELEFDLIGGTYPDYNRVIPEASKCNVSYELAFEDFYSVIKRSCVLWKSVAFRERSWSVVMKCEGDSFVKFKADISRFVDQGDTPFIEERLEAVVSGLTFPVAIRADYMSAILSAINGSTIHISFVETKDVFNMGYRDPILFRNPSDDSAMYVLMPIKV